MHLVPPAPRQTWQQMGSGQRSRKGTASLQPKICRALGVLGISEGSGSSTDMSLFWVLALTLPVAQVRVTWTRHFPCLKVSLTCLLGRMGKTH